MIEDVSSRVSKGHIRVIAICHDSDFGKFFRKPLLRPADLGLGVSPCLDHVTIEAMRKYETRTCYDQLSFLT